MFESYLLQFFQQETVFKKIAKIFIVMNTKTHENTTKIDTQIDSKKSVSVICDLSF